MWNFSWNYLLDLKENICEELGDARDPKMPLSLETHGSPRIQVGQIPEARDFSLVGTELRECFRPLLQ